MQGVEYESTWRRWFYLTHRIVRCFQSVSESRHNHVRLTTFPGFGLIKLGNVRIGDEFEPVLLVEKVVPQ